MNMQDHRFVESDTPEGIVHNAILERIVRIKNARKAGVPELERMHRAAFWALNDVRRELRELNPFASFVRREL